MTRQELATRLRKTFCVAITLFVMTAILCGYALLQARHIHYLNGELAGMTDNWNVACDENKSLRAQVKLNNQLANGIYPDVKLPGLEGE